MGGLQVFLADSCTQHPCGWLRPTTAAVRESKGCIRARAAACAVRTYYVLNTHIVETDDVEVSFHEDGEPVVADSSPRDI